MSSFKPPKDNDKYHWTSHVVRKMQFYGLTPSRVLRVIRAPDRIEEGIVEGTLAAMSPFGRSPVGRQTKPYRGEIWVMWREQKKGHNPKSKTDPFHPTKKVIITAWRYPGVSPIRDKAPIPADIISELQAEGILDD